MTSSFPILSDTIEEILLKLNVLEVTKQVINDRILLKCQFVKQFFNPYWNPMKNPITRLNPWVNDLKNMEIEIIPDNHPVYDILILKWFYVNLSDDKIFQVIKNYEMLRLACKLFMFKGKYLIGFQKYHDVYNLYRHSESTYAPFNYPILRYSWDKYRYVVLTHLKMGIFEGDTRFTTTELFISEDDEKYEVETSNIIGGLDKISEKIKLFNIRHIHNPFGIEALVKFVLTNDPEFSRLTPSYEEGRETYLNTDKLELSDTKLAAIDFFNLDEYYKK